MTYTCDNCGSEMKHAIALRSHKGSRPCRALRESKWLVDKGYTQVRHSNTQRALEAQGVGGRYRTKYTVGGIGKKARIAERYWAPKWIVVMLDDGVHLTETYKGW